jgi:magnesium transporter
VGAEAAAGQQVLARGLLSQYPGEAARVFETADDAQTAALLDREGVERSSRVIERLTPDRAARVLAMLAPENARRVLERLAPQRAALLLSRMDGGRRRERLALLAPDLMAELEALIDYPPETAGALMDPRVTSFRPDATVRDVIRRLRRFQNRRVQDLFLVDEESRLVGSVRLQDVVLADRAAALETLSREPRAVQALTPRDEVVEQLQRHRVASLPVVDIQGRLLGVLRQDELIAAARDEATAGVLRMVGAGDDERALSSPWFAVRKRLPWLQVNLLTAFLAASVVGLFEDTIARVTALAVLLPVVAGQSGNTGAQALAVTMRGLALREIRIRDWLRVAAKETLAGATNGAAVALTTSAAVWLWSSSTGLAMVIGLSMVLSMSAAGLSGALIPVVLTSLRQDPAQASSIILTTVTDVVGFFSFLGIATLLAGML